jgi:hypothetical protein
MGQAKRRGTFEERKAQAIVRRDLELEKMQQRMNEVQAMPMANRGQRPGRRVPMALSVALLAMAGGFPGKMR